MRMFVLNRRQDASGVSGTGIVAQGVEFDDGTAVLHWHGKWPTTTVFPSPTAVEEVHGHGGMTIVEYVGPEV